MVRAWAPHPKEDAIANRDIVAIGTSAGGVEALLSLAKHLPAPFPAAILVTIHLPSGFQSSLDQILTNAGRLPARFVSDGDKPGRGVIHLAPPGHHLLLEGDRFALGSGPLENSARPAIDPMLRSAAVCCGSRSVGVVLTGMLGDGASGLWALRRCGGLTVVQDPGDAAFPDMPRTALNRATPDHVVRLVELPALLTSLVHQPAGAGVPVPETLRFEVDIAKNGHSSMKEMDRIGRRSVLSCPDCGGVMWEIDEGDLVRYRCHVGHAYTAEVMSLALDESLRRALSSAHRGYQERVALMDRMHESAVARGDNRLAATWQDKAAAYRKEGEAIEDAIRRLDHIARLRDEPE